MVSTASAGQFHHNQLDTDDAPYIVMFGDLDNDTLETFQHELTHYFVSHSAPNTPLWLTEGLATYYETLRQQAGSAHLGLPNARRWSGLLSAGVVPFPDLLAARRKEFYGDPHRYYGSAWLFLHLLNTGPQGYRDRLYSYVNALDGKVSAPNAAQGTALGNYRAALIR